MQLTSHSPPSTCCNHSSHSAPPPSSCCCYCCCVLNTNPSSSSSSSSCLTTTYISATPLPTRADNDQLATPAVAALHVCISHSLYFIARVFHYSPTSHSTRVCKHVVTSAPPLTSVASIHVTMQRHSASPLSLSISTPPSS